LSNQAEGTPPRDASPPKDSTPTAAVTALFDAAASKDDQQLLRLLSRPERRCLEKIKQDDAVWDKEAIDQAIREVRERYGDSVKILQKTVEGRSLTITFKTGRGEMTSRSTAATYRQNLDMLFHDLDTGFGCAARVAREKVDGDTAVVTVETGDGDEIAFALRREDHQWKILHLRETLYQLYASAFEPWADLPRAQPRSRSVEGWIRQLQDPDPKRRREAIDALQQLGPEAKGATAALGRVLREDDKRYLRQPAADALGAIGVDALLALEEALKARDSSTRALALQAEIMIWERAEQDAEERSGPRADPPPRSLVILRARMAALATTLLQDRSLEVRLMAAEILKGLRPDARAALTVLATIATGRTADMRLREAAFKALGNMGPAAAPTLLAALTGDDAFNRDFAAYILALGEFRVPPRELAPALARSLKCRDSDRTTRELIGPWLAGLGPDAAPALPVLLDVLKDSKNSEEARAAAAAALGSIGPGAKEAVPALRAEGESRSPLLRKAVHEALEKIVPRQPAPATSPGNGT
jgi:HEAT repeat protein